MEPVRPPLAPPPPPHAWAGKPQGAGSQRPGRPAGSGALGLHLPAPRGAAVTWPRSRAGERPPSPPAPLPAANARPQSVPAASRTVTRQAAGGRRSGSPGVPAPAPGTPLTGRNVWARAVWSCKGKKLALGRILPRAPWPAAAQGPGGSAGSPPRLPALPETASALAREGPGGPGDAAHRLQGARDSAGPGTRLVALPSRCPEPQGTEWGHSARGSRAPDCLSRALARFHLWGPPEDAARATGGPGTQRPWATLL